MIARKLALILTGVAGTALLPIAGGAQSAQPWSLQASALAASQTISSGDPINGVGFEGAIRYTPSLWSFGGGFQLSTHESGDDNIRIMGVFFEPRYAFDIGSNRFAPYIAGRLAFLNQKLELGEQPDADFGSSGTAFGAGAGVIIRLTGRVNIDIGAAFVNQGFGDAEDQGITVELPRFNGYVAKAGFTFGLGS
jgi:hypothetical protein